MAAQEQATKNQHDYVTGYQSLVADLRTRIDDLEKDSARCREALERSEEEADKQRVENEKQGRRIASLERRLGIDPEY